MATKSKKSAEVALNSYATGPDDKGFFGLFGGRFVAETLMPLILDLERAYDTRRPIPHIRTRSRISICTMPAGRARSISPSA